MNPRGIIYLFNKKKKPTVVMGDQVKSYRFVGRGELTSAFLSFPDIFYL